MNFKAAVNLMIFAPLAQAIIFSARSEVVITFEANSFDFF